jgi:hypothetical protein
MITAPCNTMSLVRRRLFRALSFLSLVLCLALAVLWAWTRNHHVVVTSGIRGRLAYVAAWTEGVRLDLVSGWPTRERLQTSGGDFRQWHPHAEILSPGTMAVRFDPPGLARESGVACFRLNGGPWRARPYRGVVLRWWPLFLLTGFMPAGWAAELWTHRQRRRREARLRAEVRCVRCGYDLRATPERCPECGTAAEAASGGRIKSLRRR